MTENVLEPGVISVLIITSKYGDTFHVLGLTDRGEVVDASSGLEGFDPFREAAPEGVHTWEVVVLINQLEPISPGGNDYELPLGGASIRLKGLADVDLIKKVEEKLMQC